MKDTRLASREVYRTLSNSNVEKAREEKKEKKEKKEKLALLLGVAEMRRRINLGLLHLI